MQMDRSRIVIVLTPNKKLWKPFLNERHSFATNYSFISGLVPAGNGVYFSGNNQNDKNKISLPKSCSLTHIHIEFEFSRENSIVQQEMNSNNFLIN